MQECRKKEEGRMKKEEGRRRNSEGRWEKEEGRRKMGEGRWEKEEGSRSSVGRSKFEECKPRQRTLF